MGKTMVSGEDFPNKTNPLKLGWNGTTPCRLNPRSRSVRLAGWSVPFWWTFALKLYKPAVVIHILCVYIIIYIYICTHIIYIYIHSCTNMYIYIYLISYISHKTIESSKWVRCGKTSRGFVYNFDPQLGWSLTHSQVPVVQMGSPARAPLGDRNLFLLEAQHINISYTTLIVVHKYDISLYNINSSSCIW